MASSNHPLGIDIGGSGIKGAPVNLDTGQFAEDRKRIATPQPSTPEAVADVVVEIAKHFGGKSSAPVGITVPAVVVRGQARTAANIDSSWIGTDAESLLSDRLGRRAVVVNDADAAGLATLGTGIGSALLHRGMLIPNSELGHLEIDGVDAETQAADRARERDDLSFEQWAARLQNYFAHVEDLLSPDLIVIGGGVSKHADKYLPLLHLRAPIVPALLGNAAGIVGAAWLAAQT
jgi:polyphosphate glucokinase